MVQSKFILYNKEYTVSPGDVITVDSVLQAHPGQKAVLYSTDNIDTIYCEITKVMETCFTFVVEKIARKYNLVTDFGKFMDPLADKMLVLSAMCYFIEVGLMPGWVVAVVLLREFGVSGLRLLAVEQGIVIAAAWSGKIKTGVTMVALGILIIATQPWFPAPDVIAVICWVLILATTLYSGIEYFVKNIGVFKHCA